MLQEDSSSESNTVNLSTVNSAIFPKKCKMSRSNITLRYADKLKENYEEIQNKIMIENRYFIERLMESEKQFEKEVMNNMLESQRNMLKETTNQLLNGLQNIFAPKIPSQLSTVSVPTANPVAQSPFVISPVHYSSPFSPSNLDSQVFHSSKSFPKVLLNLKSPVPKKTTAASVQQTITAKKYLQDKNEKPILVQTLSNVTSQDSQNLKCSSTQDCTSLQFQDNQESDQI